MTDATGGDIEKSGENYVEAVDGEDLVLTIDATIQGIAEKYLKEACIVSTKSSPSTAST